MTTELRRQGFAVACFRLEGTSLVVAGSFRIFDCEIAYRVEGEHTVLIVEIRRLAAPQGLGNPFAALVWFLDLLVSPQVGMQHVLGLVHPLGLGAGGGAVLSAERIKRFYTRYLGARVIARAGRDEWIYGDLANYSPHPALVRRLRRVIGPAAAVEGE